VQFLKVAEGFQHQQIDSALSERCDLIAESLTSLFE
jgi:hypothetical protein